MIHIRMFGRFGLRDDTGSLGPRDFGGVKPKQVLQVLLLGRGQPVSKDRIADLLWGEDLPRNVSATLETYVSVLRRSLLKLSPAAASLICTEAGGYGLRSSRYTLDLDSFDELMDEARSAEPAEAARLTDAALRLVDGEVLADEPYALFAQEPREVYKERHIDALLFGARLAIARGDYRHAVTLSETASKMAPLSEGAWRKYMLAQYAMGRRTGALQAFERCRKILSEELGVEASQETCNLYAAILGEEKLANLIPSVPAPRATAALAARAGCDSAVASSIPLYGRAAELSRATAVVQEALAGRFSILALDGAAGMGKSRFLQALVDQVRSLRPDTRIGFTRGNHLKQPVPGVMACDAITAALTGIEGVAEILDGAVSRSGGVRWLALDRLAALISGAGPVMLVFDDLHEADAVTLSVLAYLRERLADAPVAVTAAAPLQLLASEHPLRMLAIDAKVHLDVLSREDVGDVPPSLWAKTGGHPQLLSACMKGAHTEADWPSALADVVIARAREAGTRAHKILLTATLFDRPFSAEELAALTDSTALEVIDELEQAVERGTLTMTGTRFSFRYQAVRDILLQSMSEPRRDLLSRRLDRRTPSTTGAVRRPEAVHASVG